MLYHMSNEQTAKALNPEIRAMGIGVATEKVILAIYTADGKRRIGRDNLGVIKAAKGGYTLTLPEGRTTTHSDRTAALIAAANFYGETVAPSYLNI